LSLLCPVVDTLHTPAFPLSTLFFLFFFFFNDTSPPEIYTLSLTTLFRSLDSSDSQSGLTSAPWRPQAAQTTAGSMSTSLGPSVRSEEHTSELQSLTNLVCRLLLEKKTADNRWNTRRRQAHASRRPTRQDN